MGSSFARRVAYGSTRRRNSPKSSEQRLATIRRSKASIERYLEQSNLEYATEMLAMAQISLNNAAEELSRH